MQLFKITKKSFSFLLILATAMITSNKALAQKTVISIQGEKINTTNSQGDNSKNIATMDFVHTAIGSVTNISAASTTISLTIPQALNSVLNVTGTLTGNTTITIPLGAARTWVVNNKTIGAFTVTVKYASGSGAIASQDKATTIYGDGLNVYYAGNGQVADAITDAVVDIAPSQNAVYDALVLKAPLASPSFSGIPLAQTATAGTDTDQLATTKFVTTAVTGIVASSLQTASETVKGITQLATPAETTAGIINTKTVHPAGLKTALDLKANLTGNNTFAGVTNTFTGTVVLPATTSIGAVTNTQIGYLAGVTSDIQTQLNGKVVSVNANPIGTAGTAPTINIGGTTTAPIVNINIPLASAAGTTAGLISNSDYAKITASNTLADGKIFVGNATNVPTAVGMSSGATISNTGVVTLDNTAVTGQLLTGLNSTAGTVDATNSILHAIGKLNGNDALKAKLAGGNTMAGVNTFTGPVTAPTQPTGTKDTTLATTAFVASAVSTSQVIEDFPSAGANQTDFILSSTPLSISNFFINGQRIAKTALTFTGTTAKYVPANNETYQLQAGDSISIQYIK